MSLLSFKKSVHATAARKQSEARLSTRKEIFQEVYMLICDLDLVIVLQVESKKP